MNMPTLLISIFAWSVVFYLVPTLLRGNAYGGDERSEVWVPTEDHGNQEMNMPTLLTSVFAWLVVFSSPYELDLGWPWSVYDWVFYFC
jgi:hypothetical protein